MTLQATQQLLSEIESLEKAIAFKRSLLCKANEAAAAVVRQACIHERKRYTGTGRHGSDKGDEYEECIQCGASFTNGRLKQ